MMERTTIAYLCKETGVRITLDGGDHIFIDTATLLLYATNSNRVAQEVINENK